MGMMDAFLAGDVYADFPYESATFWYENTTGKEFRRFYLEADQDICPISVGTLITRDD